MRYLALATDYDGTLATDGIVDDATLAALTRFRETGRRLVLVTGRDLDDLLRVFPQIHLFDLVVAENGALLYRPRNRQEQPLGPHPPEAFVKALRERHVQPLSVGRVIVATWHPNETTVLDVIRKQGLELHIIFNKGAVMVLPAGINKASGLAAALRELKLSFHNVVGIGDAENDHAFIDACECAVAVANALPMLKQRADLVTNGARGAGVAELIDRLIDSDLGDLGPELKRHAVLLGTDTHDEPVFLSSYSGGILLTGTSGSGKSTLAAGVLERLSEQGYQFCIIDPEGDYENFSAAVVLGDSQHEPVLKEVFELLEQPDQNVVINLLGVALDQRPAFFADLLPRLQELRVRTGRPHWIVIDEAHHLLPAEWDSAPLTLPQAIEDVLLITVHPEHLASSILALVQTIIAVGETPEEAFKSFASAIGQPPPADDVGPLEVGEALLWARHAEGPPLRFQIAPPKAEQQRHLRKYAEGELGEDKSFYFRGPAGKLNLRAQNLDLFNQLAAGVDDATWMYHLREGHYSEWFRTTIKDEELANDVTKIQQQKELSPQESRARVREAIEQRYTHPA